MRGDLGITYDLDVLRLIDAFREHRACMWAAWCITQYAGQPAADAFQKRLERLGVRSFPPLSPSPGYPDDIALHRQR